MDPLSITASAIAVLQISGTIISSCYEYRSRVKHAKSDASHITNELNGLRIVLESLLSTLEDEKQDESSSTLKTLAQKDGPLARCRSDLDALAIKLAPKEGWRATKATLIWPLQESEVVRVLQRIGSTKSTIQLALSADQRKATNALQNNLTSLTHQFSAVRLGTKRKEILHWLSPPNLSASHAAARKKCQASTGQWFLHGKQFENWMQTRKSFLWVIGIPGCGKTILSSTIVEDLFRRSQNTPTTTLVYFYFDFNDSERNIAEALVRSIVSQIFTQHSETPHALEILYSQAKDGEIQPPLDGLLDVLIQLLSSPGTYYIVIDALDECAEIIDVIELLQEIQGSCNEDLHIILTSRELPEIQDTIIELSTDSIRIHEVALNEDIAFYIGRRLETDTKLSKWPSYIKSDICYELNTRACGMFRWAVCQLDCLRNCLTIAQLQDELSRLPKTLEETYERILLGIDESQRDNALKILQWLAFAARPVKIEEAAEMLAVNVNEPSFYDYSRRLLNTRDVINICSTLVTISKASIYDELQVAPTYDEYEFYGIEESFESIRLAHLSVKDYLLSGRTQSGSAFTFDIDVKLANTFMAQTCVGYLMNPTFSIRNCQLEVIQDLLYKWPLYHYAAHFWPFHIREAGETLDAETWKLLQRFFATKHTQGGGNFAKWAVALTPTTAHLKSIQQTEPFFYAASFGMISVMRKLIETEPGLDIEAPGGSARSSPLHAAAYRNHPGAVKLLLEMGADPFSKNFLEESTLLWSILRGHREVQKLLEEHGARLTLEDERELRWYRETGHEGCHVSTSEESPK